MVSGTATSERLPLSAVVAAEPTGAAATRHRRCRAQPANGTTVPYGFGLQLSTRQGGGFLGVPPLGQPYVRHTGGQSGFNSFLVNFPKPDLTIVVLCNTDNIGPEIPSSIASGVLCLLHECP